MAEGVVLHVHYMSLYVARIIYKKNSINEKIWNNFEVSDDFVVNLLT